ncbi:uncharacterized protein C6orf118-like isoform X1 [Polypterus senegalus]|uniref:uncharacterized protein C6orf118-like isoform X1 n=2 Tax=Polypterus senegalus TaxID=55291 RepID=UPI001962F9A2|nr:uncharacterized protein C6orf118-like isoform X1 [Polypterus senegalus]
MPHKARRKRDSARDGTPALNKASLLKAQREEMQCAVPNKTLRELLQGIDEAHKADIMVYTSGHLNPNKLPKLTRKKNDATTWESAKQPMVHLRERGPPRKQGESLMLGHSMKEPAADFTRNPSTTSSEWPQLEPDVLKYTVANVKTPITPFGTPITKSKVEVQISGPENNKIPGESLRVLGGSAILLKTHESKYRRSFGFQNDDIPNVMQPYLSGLTKRDQFSMLLGLERTVLRKQDMSEKQRLSERRAAERHEQRLHKELMKVTSNGQSRTERLRVFSDVLNDICSESQVFGDILKKIKAEHDLYLYSLIESQSAVHQKTLLPQIEDEKVLTAQVEEARQEVLRLQKIAKKALKKNECLRNELQTELLNSGAPAEKVCKESSKGDIQCQGTIPCEDPAEKQSKDQQVSPLVESIQTKRRHIQEVREEMTILEKELKNEMVPVAVISTIESSIEDAKNDTLKLSAAKEHLEQTTLDLENVIHKILFKENIDVETQRVFWDKVKQILDNTAESS